MDSRKNLQKYGREGDPTQRFLHWVQALPWEQRTFRRWCQALNERFRIKTWSLIFLFCLLLSFLVFFSLDFAYHAQLGEVAIADIKSPLSFQIVDEQATEEKRHTAEIDVPPVFDFDPHLYEQVFNRIYRSFRDMREEVRSTPWPSDEARREEAIKDFARLKPQFDKEIGVEIPHRLFDWLTEEKFSARIENVVIRSLVKWSSKKIIDGQGVSIEGVHAPLLVRVVGRSRASNEEYTLVKSEVRDVRKSSEFSFEGILGVENLPLRDRHNALDLAQLLIVPNMNFNSQETLDRRKKARDAVLPVQISIKRNQTIVSEGQVVQPVHLMLLNEINQLKSSRRTDFVSLAVAFLFLTLVTVFFSYLRRITKYKLKLQVKDIYAMGVVLLLVVVLTKFFLFMTDAAFLSRFGNTIPASSFLYAAPIASGPMLVGLMISAGEIVWLFTFFLAITVALMADPSSSFVYLLVAAIGGIAAARGVHSCQKRNDIYIAGIRTGLVNGLVLTMVTFLQPPGEAGYLNHLMWNVPLGFLGGVLSSMVAMAFIPLLESIFNYTTDVKLLELSSLNHPLMKEMIVKAPGTYHHSLVVGSMCEAAAEEIGANPLLAKVMAYYHDIGKMEHAQYFIENQRPGHNAHDHISPNMSKTILIAHVKDGAEMGYRHKLGRAIIDGILQHHGTTLISYFYNRAIEEQNEDIDTIREDDFRYPGPKPQFKEAALLMVADSIEAAARSLEEPTAARLTSLVKNIIQNKFLDGQLDQCDLTFRDLSMIENCYRRAILGVYHQRVDYPQPTSRTTPSLPPGPSAARSSVGGKKKTFSA
jgi:putative nucleotidyltransferase with HDIG domain